MAIDVAGVQVVILGAATVGAAIAGAVGGFMVKNRNNGNGGAKVSPFCEEHHDLNKSVIEIGTKIDGVREDTKEIKSSLEKHADELYGRVRDAELDIEVLKNKQ